jgi:peptidoglycan-associated lipoprotein
VDLGVNKADIATISYGKERPLDPAQNEEAWAKNRRAHFIVKLK